MVERTEEIKKLTTDFYNNFAPVYWQRHAKVSPEAVNNFLRLLRGADILDLGCGGGRDAVLFKAKGWRPVCADLSEAMCEEAGSKGLPVILMDQENLSFGPESFSGIWSRVSLLHSPAELIPKIVEDLRNILKPKGILFLSMKASIGQFMETEIKTTENGATFYCYWPPYRLHGLLDNSGFEVRNLTVRGKDFFNERNYFEILAVKE